MFLSKLILFYVTVLYTSEVIPTELCPSISDISPTSAPFLSEYVTKWCPSMCGVVPGKTSLLQLTYLRER
jgi:hypothetical protein